ncbi:hypothetical protein [Pseudaminobacter sp. NGMCC 1.201702]|uniref:hypothetical protein n=1 Tax=Pseudaminobacter sp. NGMCC 1.201702 TaxID=3391825 RepID=UPI0039EF6075
MPRLVSRRLDCYPELTVEELLSDPVIRTVMMADGVDEAQLRELLDGRSRQQRARKSESIGKRI